MIAPALAAMVPAPYADAELHVRVVRLLHVLSGRCLEAGWLCTVLAVPVYFNVNDVRAFEPDKAILLRDLAALLGVLLLLRLTLGCLLRSMAPTTVAKPLIGHRSAGWQRPDLSSLLA